MGELHYIGGGRGCRIGELAREQQVRKQRCKAQLGEEEGAGNEKKQLKQGLTLLRTRVNPQRGAL